MNNDIVKKILQETEIGYDTIAIKFSQTRKHFWRGLEFLKSYTHPGDKVFDFGCGNGRLLELIGDVANIKYHGADVSQNLIDIAKQKYGNLAPEFDSEYREFLKLNASQDTLPFADDFFNTTYSIAVFHHFPSKEYREKMARELHRVTKKDGCVVITVWNLWQRKYFKNILKTWLGKIMASFGSSTPKKGVELPLASELDWNDCMISFTDNNGLKFHRFHHAFTKRELKKLFEKVGFEVERCKIINGRNIVLVGRK